MPTIAIDALIMQKATYAVVGVVSYVTALLSLWLIASRPEGSELLLIRWGTSKFASRRHPLI